MDAVVPRPKVYLPGPAGRFQALRDAGQPITPASVGLVDTACGGISGVAGFGLGADGGDPDFLSPAWLAALESFDAESFDDARLLLPHTLRTVVGQPFRKVPRLLALVASISPAPSGDAFAQLKDPEGHMGAALHRDVMEAVGAQLGPRAVLLLQEVCVVQPCPGLSYLCVTADNVMRVFPANAPPPAMLRPRAQPAPRSFATHTTHTAQQPQLQQPQLQRGRPGAHVSNGAQTQPRVAPSYSTDTTTASQPLNPPPPRQQQQQQQLPHPFGPGGCFGTIEHQHKPAQAPSAPGPGPGGVGFGASAAKPAAAAQGGANTGAGRGLGSRGRGAMLGFNLEDDDEDPFAFMEVEALEGAGERGSGLAGPAAGSGGGGMLGRGGSSGHGGGMGPPGTGGAMGPPPPRPPSTQPQHPQQQYTTDRPQVPQPASVPQADGGARRPPSAMPAGKGPSAIVGPPGPPQAARPSISASGSHASVGGGLRRRPMMGLDDMDADLDLDLDLDLGAGDDVGAVDSRSRPTGGPGPAAAKLAPSQHQQQASAACNQHRKLGGNEGGSSGAGMEVDTRLSPDQFQAHQCHQSGQQQVSPAPGMPGPSQHALRQPPPPPGGQGPRAGAAPAAGQVIGVSPPHSLHGPAMPGTAQQPSPQGLPAAPSTAAPGATPDGGSGGPAGGSGGAGTSLFASRLGARAPPVGAGGSGSANGNVGGGSGARQHHHQQRPHQHQQANVVAPIVAGAVRGDDVAMLQGGGDDDDDDESCSVSMSEHQFQHGEPLFSLLGKRRAGPLQPPLQPQKQHAPHPQQQCQAQHPQPPNPQRTGMMGPPAIAPMPRAPTTPAETQPPQPTTTAAHSQQQQQQPPGVRRPGGIYMPPLSQVTSSSQRPASTTPPPAAATAAGAGRLLAGRAPGIAQPVGEDACEAPSQQEIASGISPPGGAVGGGFRGNGSGGMHGEGMGGGNGIRQGAAGAPLGGIGVPSVRQQQQEIKSALDLFYFQSQSQQPEAGPAEEAVAADQRLPQQHPHQQQPLPQRTLPGSGALSAARGHMGARAGSGGGPVAEAGSRQGLIPPPPARLPVGSGVAAHGPAARQGAGGPGGPAGRGPGAVGAASSSRLVSAALLLQEDENIELGDDEW
ncbi:hypothetical protein HYH02_009072 [Chlamydomonas schloesseri]|uniref:Homologous recombination OB-fold protein OB-fold domain-containing protein n=1 Tax=Chlamydomonas schloesseri TaxID=2026947 RepID=A0A835WB92_9CHLO|nr:hypothetical protein HYH02_009072 [Chlamydomonas schloesseri]|eukprot:KAG2444132.1 hypothetical protein HYH02_009072 [Chlamydomonas schloesseri]